MKLIEIKKYQLVKKYINKIKIGQLFYSQKENLCSK